MTLVLRLEREGAAAIAARVAWALPLRGLPAAEVERRAGLPPGFSDPRRVATMAAATGAPRTVALPTRTTTLEPRGAPGRKALRSLRSLADALRVRREWLLSGEGPAWWRVRAPSGAPWRLERAHPDDGPGSAGGRAVADRFLSLAEAIAMRERLSGEGGAARVVGVRPRRRERA